MLMALDRKTGKLLWQQVAKIATPHEGYHPTYGSFASNSPVTDGKYVVAFFGSRGVYCYDLDGKKIWEKDFGIQLKMFMTFGEGAWPFIEGSKLLLLFDNEVDSFLVALDLATGKELWRTPRPDGNTNWSGPVVITYEGKKQVIVSATKKVHSYDLETGKPIWEVGGLGQNTIPAPVAGDGMVFVMSGFRNPNLLAVKLGREGDLTGTDAIVWQNQRGNSYTASPVLHDGKLYVVTDSGMLSCFDAKTGQGLLSAAAAAEAVQLQSIAGRRERQALSGHRRRRRGHRENGRDVRSAGDQYARGPDVHRDPGYRRRRDLSARANTLFCIK